MFSAKTENGPVTPRMVRGWIENLSKPGGQKMSTCSLIQDSYTEKIIPQRPVLKTTSIVPQLLPVKTYRSLAKVIPGRRLVKKT